MSDRLLGASLAALAAGLLLQSADAGEVEVEFDVPAGYVARREGGGVVVSPMAVERTPCVYGISHRGLPEAPLRYERVEPGAR